MVDLICRLCCSTKFVNNHIFNEENALYIKMSLYLPIKVVRGDRLPQLVCDRCSCRVNDLYQFCNEAIEVQKRLRSIFMSKELETDNTLDLTRIKDNIHSPAPVTHCERATQTELLPEDTDKPEPDITVKEEDVKPDTSIPVKEETAYYNLFDSTDVICNDVPSDNSEDLSLINLKKKKKKEKQVANGVGKRGRKRKNDLKEWDLLSDIDIEEEKPNDGLPGLGTKVVVKQEPTEDKYDCCMCFTVCYSRGEMLQHYRQHGDEAEAPRAPPAPPPLPAARPLRCPRCSKVLEAGAWAAHWARHWARDRRPYRCARCEKSFRDHHQILKHGLTHKGEPEGKAEAPGKRFVCDLCPEGFVYMRSLLAHRARAHPEAAARALALRCAECQRQFAHLNSLRRHLRAHSGERNFLCSVCGKALSSREHLKFHLRIHAEYKPNVCKTCGKGFVKKCNLTLHERVHSGEKPHVCSHCGKAFSQRSTLVIHERYHSGARPYACALCGRGFVAKGLLSMHLKTTCV